MARTVRLSPEVEEKLAELAALMKLSKNSVVEKAVLELHARTSGGSGYEGHSTGSVTATLSCSTGCPSDSADSD